MLPKMIKRFNRRPHTRIVMDTPIVVRDAMTAHLMQSPKHPRMH